MNNCSQFKVDTLPKELPSLKYFSTSRMGWTSLPEVVYSWMPFGGFNSFSQQINGSTSDSRNEKWKFGDARQSWTHKQVNNIVLFHSFSQDIYYAQLVFKSSQNIWFLRPNQTSHK